MTDRTTLALDLIDLDFAVFPVDPKTKHPVMAGGHLSASKDAETVATWFSGEYAGCEVAVATGASGLVVADPDRKNGKNGFDSIESGWLSLPETFHYPTPNGGEHWLYQAPTDLHLNGQADYRGLEGLDRRAGSSYIVFWGEEAPKSRDELAEAPEWLCDPAVARGSAEWSGSVAEWLEKHGEGEPTPMMQAAIDRIQTDDMSHSAMVENQFNIIRLAAEGNLGAGVALGALRDAWLSRDPMKHSTPEEDWEFKFNEAFESGVLKYGMDVDDIAALPDYNTTLDALPNSFDLNMLIGATQPKAAYHRVLQNLVTTDLSDEQIATLAFNAPTIREHSRAWGLPYLYEKIAEKRALATEAALPRENPALSLVEPEVRSGEVKLLSAKERAIAESVNTFSTRYLSWASSRARHVNAPYHRSCAFDLMELGYGMYCFMPEDEGTLGINGYKFTIGKSGTGKTRALKMRNAVLDQIFFADPGYNLGFDPSIQALHKTLLKRDNLPSAFLDDEADTTLEMWFEAKYLAGMTGLLTRLYEGYVPAQLRAANLSEDDYKPSLTSFSINMVGTPSGVIDLLTEKMFKTGFLARFNWFIGDPPIESDDRYKVSRGNRKRAEHEYDETGRAFATEQLVVKKVLGSRKPMVELDDALDRLEVAKKAMGKILASQDAKDILEPAVTRLGDNIRKAAALFAVADGRRTVYREDMLAAILQGEEWFDNLLWVSGQIAASEFQRETDEVERVLVGRGGELTMAQLTHAFKRWEPRYFGDRLASLEAQHRVLIDANRTRVTINGGKG